MKDTLHRTFSLTLYSVKNVLPNSVFSLTRTRIIEMVMGRVAMQTDEVKNVTASVAASTDWSSMPPKRSIHTPNKFKKKERFDG